ncbi:MAG: hypothetical protein FWD22_03220 [Treponema sp.]|nr:hypothetical protein [Treponema sp.]
MPEYYKKSLKLAKALFPDEEWIVIEHNVWVAKSRLLQKIKEPNKWEKEMSQVRILTGRGSVAFFLPEVEIKGEKYKRCADSVLDGEITEMKTISGTRETLGGKFRLGYKQGESLLNSRLIAEKFPKRHSVYIRLLSNIHINSVKAKIAGVLKYHHGKGSFICYFEKIGELHTWTYEELRSLIGK